MLENILDYAYERLNAEHILSPVTLRNPFPERPWRTLGLVKIDGRVFFSEKFSRVLLLNTSVAFSRGVRSIFLGPSIGLGLPIFSTEVIMLGKKTMFLVDVQRRGGYAGDDDSALYNRLTSILKKYPGLQREKAELKGEINRTLSPAHIYVKLTEPQYSKAFQLFAGYLDEYLDLVQNALPLTGSELRKAQDDFDAFMSTVIDHDPGVKVFSRFFGKKGGVDRALDMFFAR